MLKWLKPRRADRATQLRAGAARADDPVADDSQHVDPELVVSIAPTHRLYPRSVHRGSLPAVSGFDTKLEQFGERIAAVEHELEASGVGAELVSIAKDVHELFSSVRDLLGLDQAAPVDSPAADPVSPSVPSPAAEQTDAPEGSPALGSSSDPAAPLAPGSDTSA